MYNHWILTLTVAAFALMLCIPFRHKSAVEVSARTRP
jgi:hypothetical protein